jgi:hypothetical protein
MLHAFVLQYLKKSSTCDDGNLTLLVRELITAHILAKNKALDVNALQDCLEGLNPQAAGPGFKSPRMPDILSDIVSSHLCGLKIRQASHISPRYRCRLFATNVFTFGKLVLVFLTTHAYSGSHSAHTLLFL